jgi:hypothetical protein
MFYDSPEQEPGSRPDPAFSRLVAQESLLSLENQVARSQQAVRDAGELTAMAASDVTLDPDKHIDRKLDIQRHAADLVAAGTHTPTEATKYMRDLYEQSDADLAEWTKNKAAQEQITLERLVRD